MASIPKLPEALQARWNLLRNTWREIDSLPTLLARLAGIAGFTAVLVSAFESWFSVPVPSSLGGPIASEAPFVSWIYRAASLGVSGAAFLIFLRDSRWRPRLEWLYLLWLLSVLFFPYSVSVWAPDAAGRAAWLQSQHKGLIELTGDIQLSQEYKGSLMRHRVEVCNQPIESQVFWVPDWEDEGVFWGRLLEVMRLLGFSDWFACFLRRGWLFALGGAVLTLFALAREAEPSVLQNALKLLRRGGAVFLAMLVAALLPVFIGRNLLIAAKHCAQAGEYASARRLMRWGAWCGPVITEEGDFILQTGLLADALGLPDPEATYYRARVAEDAGFRFQAQTMYLEGLSADRNQPALLREQVKGVLRHATNAMDTGELDLATALFEQALAADPANIEANYCLQLAYLQTGNVNGLRALQQQMVKVYGFINTPLKGPVLANSIENLAAAEITRGDAAAALKASIEARNP